MNAFQFIGKPDNAARSKINRFEHFHVGALDYFPPRVLLERALTRNAETRGIWSLTERTPLLLATEATWDSISYYIFSEVIEASAPRKEAFTYFFCMEECVQVCLLVIRVAESKCIKRVDDRIAWDRHFLLTSIKPHRACISGLFVSCVLWRQANHCDFRSFKLDESDGRKPV